MHRLMPHWLSPFAPFEKKIHVSTTSIYVTTDEGRDGVAGVSADFADYRGRSPRHCSEAPARHPHRASSRSKPDSGRIVESDSAVFTRLAYIGLVHLGL